MYACEVARRFKLYRAASWLVPENSEFVEVPQEREAVEGRQQQQQPLVLAQDGCVQRQVLAQVDQVPATKTCTNDAMIQCCFYFSTYTVRSTVLHVIITEEHYYLHIINNHPGSMLLTVLFVRISKDLILGHLNVMG